MIYPNLKAGTGSVHPYSIIMQLANGRWASVTTTAPNNPGASNVSPKETGKAANTNEFRLGPIYVMYANATYADGANIGTYNVWAYHSGLIDCRYSFNLQNNSTNGFTAYAPVYLVGTLSNGYFKLDTTKWWTCTLPSSDDSKVYIHIGDAIDWYRITLQEIKPIYWYKDGAIRLYSPATKGTIGLGNVENTALSTWVGTNKITTLGTVTTGTWSASTIAVGKGGTGTTTAPTQGGIIYGSSNSAYACTGAGTSGQFLKSNGTSAPTWETVSSIVAIDVTATTATSTTISNSKVTANHIALNDVVIGAGANITVTTAAGSVSLACSTGIPAFKLILTIPQ